MEHRGSHPKAALIRLSVDVSERSQPCGETFTPRLVSRRALTTGQALGNLPSSYRAHIQYATDTQTSVLRGDNTRTCAGDVTARAGARARASTRERGSRARALGASAAVSRRGGSLSARERRSLGARAAVEARGCARGHERREGARACEARRGGAAARGDAPVGEGNGEVLEALELRRHAAAGHLRATRTRERQRLHRPCSGGVRRGAPKSRGGDRRRRGCTRGRDAVRRTEM